MLMRKYITPWRLGVVALTLFTSLTTLWQLQRGQRSEYYAAIATSMSRNLGNFFFGSLDPAGTVTLDKIPGSYWIPAIFVRILGVHTWSFNAPNALATVSATLMIAYTFKKLVGATGGIIAGFIYGSTPIVIAVGRSNQPQSFFLLALALVLWRAVVAFETQRRRDLVVTGAMIALAFHTYMLEAWAIWPALILAWFFTDKKVREKVTDLALAGSLSLALSLTWILIVFLVPRSHRPYIGGTYRNNPFEMVFGYNGLGRFSATSTSLSSESDNPIFRSFTPPFGGQAGWGRLFNYQVAGQIAWLLPAAIIAIAVAFASGRHRQLVIFLSGWFVTFFIVLSQVAGIHQFYVSALALPIAGLIAIAYTDIHARGRDWMFALILIVTGIWSIYLSARYSGYMDNVSLVQAAIAAIAVSVLYMEFSRIKQLLLPIVLVVALTLTPSAWALDAHNHESSINPIAGPESAIGGMLGARAGGPGHDRLPPPGGVHGNGRGPTGNPGGFGSPEDHSALIKYLQQNREGAKFLLIVFGGMTAAPFITQTRDNVMPVGGFDGQDPTPTLEKFKELVNKGDVKYVMLGGERNRSSDMSLAIASWVMSSCTRDSAAPTSNLYRCG